MAAQCCYSVPPNNGSATARIRLPPPAAFNVGQFSCKIVLNNLLLCFPGYAYTIRLSAG